MIHKQFVFIAVLFAAVLGLSGNEAEAARYKLGRSESIVRIQHAKDPTYAICYKTTTYFFIAGVYFSNDGYVLQKQGNSDSYIPLTTEEIQRFQQEGSLPDPMPKYSIPLMEYLFGYSLWILIAVFIGGSWIWNKFTDGD